MNLRRLSLAITVMFVMVATLAGVATQSAFAATVCSPTRTVSGPFAQDGAGDLCFQTTNLCTYINSWNLGTLEINGTSYLNSYVFSNTIPAVNGAYVIHYVSTVAWGHFEFGGTCAASATATTGPTATRTNTPTGPTATRTNTPTGPTATLTSTIVAPSATPTATSSTGACSPVTATITAPFTQDGAGTFCWQASSLGSYINSWNLANLTINGVTITNIYTASSSYPAKINGFWYISYTGNFAWSHFETK